MPDWYFQIRRPSHRLTHSVADIFVLLTCLTVLVRVKWHVLQEVRICEMAFVWSDVNSLDGVGGARGRRRRRLLRLGLCTSSHLHFNGVHLQV